MFALFYLTHIMWWMYSIDWLLHVKVFVYLCVNLVSLYSLSLKKGDEKPNKDFKKTRTKEDVDKVFTEFIGDDEQIRVSFL